MDLNGAVLADRYQLLRLIGRGGMGEVWQGRDTSVLQRDVAVKLLPAVSGAVSVQRFEREAAMLARLQHPGITVVHDAGRHEGCLYIVMELLKGQDLARTMTDSPGGLPVERVLDFLHQIADALAKAHHDGVVHRDLKPANLFVQPGDRIKICDFGIARSADASDALTTSGVVLGTLPYMSPEQCQGRPAEASSDLYALGVVAFELLAGRTPFPADQAPYALMRQHVEEPPPPLGTIRSGVPPTLADLVARLLAKEPGERPDAAALARALADIGDGSTEAEQRSQSPVSGTATERLPPLAGGGGDDGGHAAGADGPGPTRLLPVGGRRKRLVLTSASVLCAAGLVLGIALLRDGDEARRPDWTLGTDGAVDVAFSPDGTMLAAGGHDAPVLRLDPRNGKDYADPLHQEGNVREVVFSPDGTVLAASTLLHNGTVRLWNARTGVPVAECNAPGAVSMDFHPDSTALAVASQETGAVSLCDPKTGDWIRDLESGAEAQSLAFDPDGTRLATGHEDGTVRFWNPDTGKEIGDPLEIREGPVKELAFSPDGTMLATTSDGDTVTLGGDDTVQLWNTETSAPIGDPLVDHGDHVSSLTFSPDGDTLALTTAEPNTAQLWDPKSGKRIGPALEHESEVTDAAFSPDGTTLATAFGGDTVGVWRLPSASTGS